MKIKEEKQNIKLPNCTLPFQRDKNGVIEFWAQNSMELMEGIGFIHAYDRFMQMHLTKIIGQGRICEILRDTPQTFEMDRLMREIGFEHYAKEELKKAQNENPELLNLLNHYCAGINHCLENYGIPHELKLLGIKPTPWKPEDCILTAKVMIYVGLAQSQQDLEKFIIECIQNNVDSESLKKIFYPYLNELSTEIIQTLKKTQLFQSPGMDVFSYLPNLHASNNWALSGGKTVTGTPFSCFDPHLEINRLPAIWYEFIAHLPNDTWTGITVPGTPGLAMGRTQKFSFSFTYGYMDMIDYFIEDCHENQYRRGNEWKKFSIRNETIHRKKNPSIDIRFYENELGVIEQEFFNQNLNGYFLNRAMTIQKKGGLETLNAIQKALFSKNIDEFREQIANVGLSCNWLLADQNGNIILQQSGIAPKRKNSGLFPLPAWDTKNHWDGFLSKEDLVYIKNPSQNFLSTANNDLCQKNKPLTINMSMSPYRFERINQLLSSKDKFTLNDMKEIQRDIYSIQAAEYLKIIRSLLEAEFLNSPYSKQAQALLDWDFRYSKESKEATLFESFYSKTIEAAFGHNLFDKNVWQKICTQTSITKMLYYNFDKILLERTPIADEQKMFTFEQKINIFRKALRETFQEIELDQCPLWGEFCTFTMSHLLFGQLPHFLGYNHGPITLEGSRATIVQGGITMNHGRKIAFWPSYRGIVDLGLDGMLSCLAGGVSGSRFSPYYKNEVQNWIQYKYKEIKPQRNNL